MDASQIKLFISQHVKLFCLLAVSSLCILLTAAKYQPTANISFSSTTFNKTVIINYVIQLQRTTILQEMRNFQYPSGRFGINAENLADLTPESGGTPVRSVIISTWRSGSTFLGEILNAMPGNYYHYEPLLPFGLRQIRGPPNDKKAIRNLKKLLNCDYSDMNEYLEFENSSLVTHNPHLQEYCKQYPLLCYDSKFLTDYCKLFPLQSMKIVHLRLDLAAQLLNDEALNVRILLLVRDPRGTMHSRKNRQWCFGHVDCYDASYLCNDLVSDYYAANILIKKYPTRFRVVRYEDLSISPFDMSKYIIQFFGLLSDPMVDVFLDSHTNPNNSESGTTFRNSKSTPFQWIKNLKWFEIEEIEKICGKAIDLWGYRKMESSNDQNVGFDSVLPLTFLPDLQELIIKD